VCAIDLTQLEEIGYQARVVPIQRLYDLQGAIEGHRRQRLLDEDLYRRYLAGFVYGPPKEMPEARSLIIVAYPDPQVRFVFHWQGRRIPAMVPPTYLHGLDKDAQVERLLTPQGHRVVPAVVPKKLLAVCSGLAEYGKNNITYVAGLGSFHRLAAFCSDMPCEHDVWGAPRLLQRCERCRACLRACPAGAITPERFLLHAERCITFWNEKSTQEPFPNWMDSGWHNALVGCMHCQRACPENREALDRWQEGAEFSEEETELLADGVPIAALPPVFVTKLQQWDLIDLLDVLPRNLAALLDKRESLPA
jgi:epoxyqueuosine reductase